MPFFPAWRPHPAALLLVALCALAGTALAPARAAPIVVTSDDDLIERLPASATVRRQASRDLAGAAAAASGTGAAGVPARPVGPPTPADAQRAAQEARTLLEAARAEGDPRAAGQALALLARWKDDPRAPSAVVLMLATVEQFLHDFDTAAARLDRLVLLDPRQPQAWLTLATLRRLRGNYGWSDEACHAVLALGVTLHGQACLAENLALRGDTVGARRILAGLLQATPDPGSRNWLLTTLAEAEQRDGRPRQAEAAFTAALQAADDGYTALDYADLLLEQNRPAQALQVLKNQPRSDAVLLRLAIAGRRAHAPQAAADLAELGDRFAQAALRPGGTSGHAREHALYWLDLRDDPAAALVLAGDNIRQQREPIDLLLYARAARAAHAPQALAALAHLKKVMRLHDRRLDALL